jgi:xylulose-5-phosphate/fructose-6-phosphate phosphoketolase
MEENKIEIIKKYIRALNYLSVTQIYLQNNCLLERPLKPDDIKPRLLGHWGTCPGINFTYAHLNYLIRKHTINMLFVLGPGHGFPAIQSNLFLEGTLQKFFPNATLDEDGIQYISKNFSWPYGFPSHSHPGSPGVILEGGELGYSLSTSFGAVLDNPNLIVACLVGDGEAETGPTATAWHLNKFLNPKTSGAVLPILHLNGYKISGPTIFGRMSEEELQKLFEGYGYDVHFVNEGQEEHQKMQEALEESYSKIKEIQKTVRGGKEVIKPKWPMIILNSPKGWTGIKEIHDEKIEGNCLSHQVVVKNPRIDSEELEELERWLMSYKFEELFDKETGFIQEFKQILPEDGFKMGENKHAFGGPDVYKPLLLPDIKDFEIKFKKPGTEVASSMKVAGAFMNQVFKNSEADINFRVFSPDETYSNKVDKIFESTARVFTWPIESWDKDLAYDGRVVEMLSEHSLQGLMQGYVLTGRHAVFPSYEAFIQVIASMADQYAKFLHQSREYAWRGVIPSVNYILTSSGWRQDHNGFSHQNPAFIDDMLQRQGDFINVYFPADQNTTLVVLERALSSTNGINVIVADKQDEFAWVPIDLVKQQIKEGLAVWDFASDSNPDLIVSSAGDHLTNEALACVDLLKDELPNLNIRFVNVISFSWSGFGEGGNVLSKDDFEKYYTKDKPVVFNFHGYPQTLKQLIFDYTDNPSRFKINGYNENGSTTTPFDMQVRNGTSRYNLILDAINLLYKNETISKSEFDKIKNKYDKKLLDHREYIKKYGIDPDEINEWKWTRS